MATELSVHIEDLSLLEALEGALKAGATDNDIAFATVVALLRNAGAILLGKTNTPEFTLAGGGITGVNTTANIIYGISRNPYDQTRTTSGSSGGASVPAHDPIVYGRRLSATSDMPGPAAAVRVTTAAHASSPTATRARYRFIREPLRKTSRVRSI